ncbi:MAG: FAD-dependent oxidoreductase [Candidatus Electrothrix sp. LOE2]|nr:FAD-dependent oxidoreductase [Candidatus Electrothrix sp. LOE2]
MTKKILVMGGGIAGLTAAAEAAKAGYEVTVVEKTDKLGGKALGWRKMFPTAYPYSELEQPNIEQMIAEVTGNDKISDSVSPWRCDAGSAPQCLFRAAGMR